MKFFLFFFFCIFWLILFFLFSFLRWFNYFDFLLRRLTNRWSCLGCFNRFSLLFFHYFLWLYTKILTLFLCDSKTSSSIFKFNSLNFSLLSWHIINFIDLFYKSIGVVLWTFYDFLTLLKAKTDINFFLSIIFLILIWLLLSTNFYYFWSLYLRMCVFCSVWTGINFSAFCGMDRICNCRISTEMFICMHYVCL